jgi:hypothetical protein
VVLKAAADRTAVFEEPSCDGPARFASRSASKRDHLASSRPTFEPARPDRGKLHQRGAVVISDHQRALAQGPLPTGEEISGTTALGRNTSLKCAGCGIKRHGAHTGSRRGQKPPTGHVDPGGLSGARRGLKRRDRYLAGWRGSGRCWTAWTARARHIGKPLAGAAREQGKSRQRQARVPRQPPSADRPGHTVVTVGHVRSSSE